MKTAIETATNVSVHLYGVDSDVAITAEGLTFGGVVDDETLTTENAQIINDVTPPDDWYGRKYLLIDGEWVANPDDPAL